jgi:hypothetical protein
MDFQPYCIEFSYNRHLDLLYVNLYFHIEFISENFLITLACSTTCSRWFNTIVMLTPKHLLQ